MNINSIRLQFLLNIILSISLFLSLISIAYLYKAGQRPQYLTDAASLPAFSNFSSSLTQEAAVFAFSHNRAASISASYIIEVSLDKKMSTGVISPFASGTKSPLVVQSPQGLWSEYKCNANVYWRVVSTSKGRITKSGIQKGTVICLSPTPTPIASSLAPITANTKIVKGTNDGSWCHDFDGVDAGPYGATYSVNNSQSFCQDVYGTHVDYCTGNEARDYYCQYTWDGVNISDARCRTGGLVCDNINYTGDACVRGSCTQSAAPQAVSTSSIPSQFTMQGSDGSWCYATNVNRNMSQKGTCQDKRGLYTDYCNGSIATQKYYCTGDWSGSSYKNVRCEVALNSCSGEDYITGNSYVCQDGTCKLMDSKVTLTPAATSAVTLTAAPTIPTSTPLVTATPTPTPTVTPTPIPPSALSKRVFVSSVFSNGNLGGLAGADSRCQTRAQSVGLGGTWKAWLSDSTTSAASRITNFNGQYIRIDGVKVANDWAGLTSGTLLNKITISEKGTDITNLISAAWTGTNTDGSIRTPNCSDWTSGVASLFGGIGGINITNSYWTVGASPNYLCSSNATLYCIEQ